MFESIVVYLKSHWQFILALLAAFFLCFHFLKSLIKAVLIIAVLAVIMQWLMRLSPS